MTNILLSVKSFIGPTENVRIPEVIEVRTDPGCPLMSNKKTRRSCP